VLELVGVAVGVEVQSATAPRRRPVFALDTLLFVGAGVGVSVAVEVGVRVAVAVGVAVAVEVGVAVAVALAVGVALQLGVGLAEAVGVLDPVLVEVGVGVP
jgi:hypothetical protein